MTILHTKQYASSCSKYSTWKGCIHLDLVSAHFSCWGIMSKTGLTLTRTAIKTLDVWWINLDNTFVSELRWVKTTFNQWSNGKLFILILLTCSLAVRCSSCHSTAELWDVHVSVGVTGLAFLRVATGSAADVFFALLVSILWLGSLPQAKAGISLCRDLEAGEGASQRWPLL